MCFDGKKKRFEKRKRKHSNSNNEKVKRIKNYFFGEMMKYSRFFNQLSSSNANVDIRSELEVDSFVI